MRSFIAIELPGSIKGYLSGLQDKIRRYARHISWVKAQDMHLTLKFLGQISAQQAQEVGALISDIALKNRAFNAGLAGMAAFPTTNNPRVIWVGIREGDSQIKDIAAQLDRGLENIGIAMEKNPFHAHITIGRVRRGGQLDKCAWPLGGIADNPADNLTLRVGKISLFKSTLTPQGPIYELLKEASLSAS